MTEDLRISPRGATIEAALEKCPAFFLEEAVAATVESTMLIEREVKERTPTSGAATLRESIGAMPVVVSAQAVRGQVATSLAYAAPVEHGSKPHWAPIEPLIDWVTRKLGKRGEEAEEVASAIRFKIAARGTEGAHMFRDGVKAAEGQVVGFYEAAAARALARLEEAAR